MSSANISRLYVKDTAGSLWFAVIRDTSGRRNRAIFYTDANCTTRGEPAPGVLVPVVGSGGGGGGATPVPPKLEPISVHGSDGRTIPAGNRHILVKNIGPAPIVVAGMPLDAGEVWGIKDSVHSLAATTITIPASADAKSYYLQVWRREGTTEGGV